MHFLHCIWISKPDSPRITTYERWCSGISDQRGGFSSIYSLLVEAGDKHAYARSWELDLEGEWDVDTCHHCLQRSFKGVINVSVIEANVKIILHWYLVLDTSPLCFRVCGLLGTFFHTWWASPRIQGFWNKVFQMICKVTGCPIRQNPQLALLNRQTDITKHNQSLLFFMLLYVTRS